MLTRIFSCAVIVEVEIDTGPGLPDAAVQESRQRVQAAIWDTGSANCDLNVIR